MKIAPICALTLLASLPAVAQVKPVQDTLKTTLDEIEVFGEKNRQQKGLEAITRMPLKPSDQIQSISIISNKVIEAQGALTITDAVRNIPGVTLFGNYGGVKESMSTRGFRGVPVLKNGVRMDSQFQSAAGVSDMQGVESIQMIKGSAAITQGVISDLGNAGGVINIVTKTPNFTEQGKIGIRTGSWGQFRPTFDYQTPITEEGNVAIRVNGAYERADSYRKLIHSNRVYFNPSLAWKASDKTTVVIEGDYLNDNRTPHSSAVNLSASQGENALYVLPNNKFLGFDIDNNNSKLSSIMARVDHQLNEKFKLRGSFAKSSYQVDNISTATAALRNSTEYNIRNRTLSRSLRDDKNSTFQFDVIGQDLKTGAIKHTAQMGFDYRVADATTTGFTVMQGTTANAVIDKINIFEDYTNTIGADKKVSFVKNDPVNNYYSTFGILAQDVVEFNKYIKGTFGLRYSEITTKDQEGTSAYTRSAWNPMVGVMVSPIKQLNLFGSYTNSTNLRNAAQTMRDGSEVGASKTEQFETGIKSDWINNRLRFNLTYFYIYTSNLANTEYIDGTNTATGYVFKAGDLKRTGLEVELNGRVLENLTVMLGYAYLDARYENSPSYVNGSAPMNAPDHTANAWVQYDFRDKIFNGLSLSFGAYYVGDRPVNEYSLTPDGHGNMGGVEPFNMPSYTTLNAQVGYKYKKVEARVYLNNLGNSVGLNSYFRGGYINQTDPRNFSVALNYNF